MSIFTNKKNFFSNIVSEYSKCVINICIFLKMKGESSKGV